MSLRELPPNQEMTPSRWTRFRYVPLIILVICSLIAAVVGLVVSRGVEANAAAVAAGALPAPIAAQATKRAALPDSCHPAVAAPPQQPWLAGDRTKAEAIWTAHAGEMTEAYVSGEDDWVFWGDIQAMNFSQAVGRRVLSNDEAGRWHDYLAGLRDALAAENIPFYIAVTPGKWDVYPQELPDWSQELRGSVSLDQLLASYPDLPIVDLRTPLRDASTEHPTYSRVNSHWTDYGAYVGWQQIAACIDATAPQLGDLQVPPIDGVALEGGNNEFAPYGFVNPSPDWSKPEFSEELKPVVLSRADGATSTVEGSFRTGLEMLPAETVTQGAQSDATALVLRDSFGSSLSVYLQQSFAQTWQVRHNLDFASDQLPDIAALVAEHHPDVVILQVAERHLNFPPLP